MTVPTTSTVITPLMTSVVPTSGTPRRGTLADLGRSFAVGSKSRKSSPNIQEGGDFMSKIRKRRETSADITVYRKGSGTASDLKSDISR